MGTVIDGAVTVVDTKTAAELALLQAQTRKAESEARKEELIAKQHELTLDEMERTQKTMMASNSEHRVLDFIGSVSTVSTEAAIATLSRWKRLSKDPITIRITSPGGQVFEGLALYDFIKNLSREGIKVTTIAYGMAASMATVILQAGDRRVISPNAQVMIHEMEVQFPAAKVSEQAEQTKQSKKLNDRLFEILAARSKLSKTEIAKRALKTDWWMNAEEAVQLGIADAIGFE